MYSINKRKLVKCKARHGNAKRVVTTRFLVATENSVYNFATEVATRSAAVSVVSFLGGQFSDTATVFDLVLDDNWLVVVQVDSGTGTLRRRATVGWRWCMQWNAAVCYSPS